MQYNPYNFREGPHFAIAEIIVQINSSQYFVKFIHFYSKFLSCLYNSTDNSAYLHLMIKCMNAAQQTQGLQKINSFSVLGMVFQCRRRTDGETT